MTNVCNKDEKLVTQLEALNVGAKVLSAKLATKLNILITPQSTCLCNGREHLAKPREIRQTIAKIHNTRGSRKLT